MSFYLLKSTYNREEIGDTIILKSEICLLDIIKVIRRDEIHFSLSILLKCGRSSRADFIKEEELINTIKELIGGFYGINEIVPAVINENSFQDMLLSTTFGCKETEKVAH